MIKKIFFILAIAILFFMCGFFTSFIISKRASERSYQEGWEAAKKRLYETGVLEAEEIKYPIKSLSGVIEKVDNGKLSVKINSVEALADSNLDNRIVEIGSGTKIQKYTAKNQEDYDKEINERKSQGILEEPAIYYTKEVEASELTPGRKIEIIASDDIRNAKQFVAIEVNIFEKN